MSTREQQNVALELPNLANDTISSRADLLLCRAGASTVAEITAAGKPAIFIPLPTAADDHQTQNAKTLANAGAARLLPQTELSAARLAQEVASLLDHPAELDAMATRDVTDEGCRRGRSSRVVLIPRRWDQAAQCDLRSDGG